MPLNTAILRDGEPLPLRWGGFHIASMVLAAFYDQGIYHVPQDWAHNGSGMRRIARRYPTEPLPIPPIFSNLVGYPAVARAGLGHDGYTLRHWHRFVDVTDGELLELRPGDVLIAYRTGGW